MKKWQHKGLKIFVLFLMVAVTLIDIFYNWVVIVLAAALFLLMRFYPHAWPARHWYVLYALLIAGSVLFHLAVIVDMIKNPSRYRKWRESRQR